MATPLASIRSSFICAQHLGAKTGRMKSSLTANARPNVEFSPACT